MRTPILVVVHAAIGRHCAELTCPCRQPHFLRTQCGTETKRSSLSILAMVEPTYKVLIRTIPPRLNLANAATQEASKTCQYCSTLVPDRSNIKDGLIRTSYERIDLYPDFAELKASAKAGCGLCRLIRKTIRSAWAVRPMEEWGVGPLSEKDSYWDELFASTWDKKIRIHSAKFSVSDIHAKSQTSSRQDAESVVVSLSMEFGPLTKPHTPDGDQDHGEIGQVISFKVFDQQGTGSF